MWLMLQQDEPEDFVIATGQAHSVRDCVNVAFDHVGLDPAEYLKTDEALMRPAEVDHLIGDYGKAKRLLGWEPRTSFEDLIRLMVDADLKALQTTLTADSAGEIKAKGNLRPEYWGANVYSTAVDQASSESRRV